MLTSFFQVFPLYLTHTAHTTLLQPYLNSTAIAQQKGKKMLMFETNTVSVKAALLSPSHMMLT
jgi:hypothetical protein